MDKMSVLFWMDEESYSEFFASGKKILDDLGISSGFRQMDEDIFHAKGKRLLNEAVENGVKVIICAESNGDWMPGLPQSIAMKCCGRGITVIGVAIATEQHPLWLNHLEKDWIPSARPVAFTGVNEIGAVNAALLAANILAGAGLVSGDDLREVFSQVMTDGMNARIAKWKKDGLIKEKEPVPAGA